MKWFPILLLCLCLSGCQPSLLRVQPSQVAPPGAPGIMAPTEYETWHTVVGSVLAIVGALAYRALDHKLKRKNGN